MYCLKIIQMKGFREFWTQLVQNAIMTHLLKLLDISEETYYSYFKKNLCLVSEGDSNINTVTQWAADIMVLPFGGIIFVS